MQSLFSVGSRKSRSPYRVVSAPLWTTDSIRELRRGVCVLSENMGKPRDDKDAAQDLVRDLAGIAGQLASLKGDARAWLSEPNYDTLKLRAGERTLSARGCCSVEARRRVRLNEDR